MSSALSGATSDARQSLARLPTVIVPRLADFSIVSLVEDDGSVQDVGSHHQDPAKVSALREYCRFRHEGLDPAAWAVRSRRTGRMVTVPYPAWENVLPLLGHDVARERLVQLRPAFVLVVPLLWALIRALQPNAIISAPPDLGTFFELTFDNFRGIQHQGRIPRAAGNSLIVAVSTALLTTVLASPPATASVASGSGVRAWRSR